MEHRHQLPGGELVGVGEEAAREDLEREVPRCIGEAQPVQEGRRALTVVSLVRRRKRDVQELQGRADVYPGQPTHGKRRTLGDEGQQVERRRPRDAAKDLGARPTRRCAGEELPLGPALHEHAHSTSSWPS